MTPDQKWQHLVTWLKDTGLTADEIFALIHDKVTLARAQKLDEAALEESQKRQLLLFTPETLN